MTKLSVLVMDSSGANWVETIQDVQHIDIGPLGFPGPRVISPQLGRAQVIFVNQGNTYTPDVIGSGTALLRARRRIAIKATSEGQGKALQVRHSGVGGGGGTTTISATGILLPVGNNATNVLTITASGGTSFLGNNGTNNFQKAQTFLAPVSGVVTQFVLHFAANVGSPSGTVTWEICADDAGGSAPGTVLKTSTFTPTASADNTINISSGPSLVSGTRYWLRIYPTTIQASNNYWQVQKSTTDAYAGGDLWQKADAGAWTKNGQTIDLQLTLTQTIPTQQAQSFQVTAGTLTQITFQLGANVGSPASTMTWEVRNDAGGTSGPGATVLASGTLTPTASALNTITVAGGPTLSAATKYWLVLKTTSAQAAGVYWQWQAQSSSTYANGNTSASTDLGVTYVDAATQDAQCGITTVLIQTYFSQQVTQAVAISDVWTLQWDARTTFDSRQNTDGVRIITSAENGPLTVKTYDNKWQTFTLSFTSTAIASTTTVQFFSQSNGPNGNAAVAEYRRFSLTKNGGANLLVNGDFASGVVSPWTVTNAAAGTDTLTVIDDYRFLFNGYIDRVKADWASAAGDRLTVVDCVDYVAIFSTQTIDQPLQKVQRADQLNTTALSGMPAASLSNTLPGTMQDQGKAVFQRAFDGYVADQTTVFQALADSTLSEWGRWWVDRDGTFRFVSREYVVQRIIQATVLALTDGMGYTLVAIQDAFPIINKAKVKVTPRQSVAGVVLGQIQSPLSIPGAVGGVQGQTTVTITFHDAAGKPIGGDNVIPPVAVTDWKLSDNPISANGFDYTTNVNLRAPTFIISASQITCTFYNFASGQLWIFPLQVRGTGVYQYDPVTITQDDLALQAQDLISMWNVPLPFTDDVLFAGSLAYYLVQRYKQPILEVQAVTAPFKTALGGVDLLSVEMLDVIAITDAKAGLSAVRHIVTSFACTIDVVAGSAALSSLSWSLERIDDVAYGIYDDPVYGVADSTMRAFI